MHPTACTALRPPCTSYYTPEPENRQAASNLICAGLLCGYHGGVSPHRPHLSLDDAALTGECDVHLYRSSGPGGQHRNKVSSAVRLRHRPTGVTAQAEESRSQHDNRRMALRRLRMNLACRHRFAIDPGGGQMPSVVAECLFTPRGRQSSRAARRLQVGRKDHRFWSVAAILLDALDAHAGRLAETARFFDIATANLVDTLKSDRHLLGAAQAIRKQHGQKPVT